MPFIFYIFIAIYLLIGHLLFMEHLKLGGPESDLLIASLGNKKLAKKLATPGGRARALVSLTAKSIFMHYFVWPGYAIFKAPGTLVSYKQDTWRPEKPELRLVKK